MGTTAIQPKSRLHRTILGTLSLVETRGGDTNSCTSKKEISFRIVGNRNVADTDHTSGPPNESGGTLTFHIQGWRSSCSLTYVIYSPGSRPDALVRALIADSVNSIK